MQAPVEYRGQQAGFVQVEQDARGLRFEAVCHAPGGRVLRLYAAEQGRPLRIGVLEPNGGALGLSRRWSPETMRGMGISRPPARFYLDDGEPGCLPQADPARSVLAPPPLAAAVARGAARYDEAGNCLTAPFVPGQAHALDFALTACTIRPDHGGFLAVLPLANLPEEPDGDTITY